jgi:hypothetical protein
MCEIALLRTALLKAGHVQSTRVSTLGAGCQFVTLLQSMTCNLDASTSVFLLRTLSRADARHPVGDDLSLPPE